MMHRNTLMWRDDRWPHLGVDGAPKRATHTDPLSKGGAHRVGGVVKIHCTEMRSVAEHRRLNTDFS